MKDRVSIFEQSQVGTLILRPDLVHRRIEIGQRSHWVTKDPVSGKYFYFSDREFTILKSLKNRGPAEIIRSYTKKYANDFLSADMLVSFLAQVYRNGLVYSPLHSENDLPKTHVPARGPRSTGMLSPLAVRLPGINPDRFLSGLHRRLQFVFSLPIALLLTALCCVALCIAVVRFEVLVDELRTGAAWSTPGLLIAMFLIISATKILHELGHGIACKHFGSTCSEMGLMFLVFVPCLYCDVSDSWMQRSSSRRILIAAAGMLTEFVVASVATVIWALTLPGTLHSVCVGVMIVCSVSTIAFNANPLMRYDGYYILSDLVRIPNLAAESARCLHTSVRRWFWSSVDPGVSESKSSRPWILISYALASLGYRILIVGAIILMIHRFAESWQLKVVAWTMTAWILGGMFVAILNRGKTYLPSAAERRKLGPTAYIRPAVLLSLLLVLLCVPLPRTIGVPYLAQPSKFQEVYATVPGELIDAMPLGSSIGEGETIARLRNREHEIQTQRLKIQQANLQSRLERVERLRSQDPTLGAEIPTLKESIQAVEQKQVLLNQEIKQQEITAGQDGYLYAFHDRAPQETMDQWISKAWYGSPLEEANLGSYIERGTPIAIVGDKINQVVLNVGQSDIDFVRVGQRAWVYFPGREKQSFEGSVVRIHATKVAQVDKALSATQRVAVELSNPEQPLESTYRVDVVIDDERLPLLPMRQVGMARVEVLPMSLLNRVSRYLADALSFKL